MTKNRSKTITLLILTLLFTAGLRAQSIHFKFTDDTKASYKLQDVRKITFDADVMNLQLRDGSVYAWNVSTIGHYLYNELPLNVEEWLNHANAWDVMVFPNPTSTQLNVFYKLPKEDVITLGLYDLQGKLIMEQQVGKKSADQHQETLDISNVPEGTYVYRISGLHQSVTKKIIKN